MKKPIKAIVWDLDGTLIHFKIDFLRARRNAIELLKKSGVPREILTVKFSILDNIREARLFFEKTKREPEEVSKILKEVDEAVQEVEREAALQAKVIDGMQEVLKFAKAHHLRQAIYTYNTQKNAELSLQIANIIDFFDLIIGRDNVNNPKPHPDHLNLICERLGVSPQEVVVIGDSDRDIQGALELGAHSILILTKISKNWSKDMIDKADFMIQETELPSKLIEAIKSLL
ncbi:MAG: HAD family hydrolase [Promethearchaeota archaeon]